MWRKPDAEAIEAFFDELASQTWLGYRRKRWPEFFFHVTDVKNAVAILSSGRLLCRNHAVADGLMVSDNASADVLGQSDPRLFNFVRLYFRPKTPTFWNNEGIRPAGFRPMNAHCPVPIALLFDAKKVACLDQVQFSDGTLARQDARQGEDALFLQTLTFQDIYHDAGMPEDDRERLRRRRHAEIIVPEELSLGALRFVAARSEPERQTLLSLLGATRHAQTYSPETFLTDPNLFYCQWSYIERATMSGNQLLFLFNPDSLTPGPFPVWITWENPDSGASTITHHSFRAIGNVNVTIPEQIRGSQVKIELYLDDSLAFSGVLDQTPATTLLR